LFAVGKSRGRLEYEVWRAVLDFLQIQDRKLVARKKEGWRQVIEEAVARKRAETP
jgi:hypothetical protein